MEGGKTGFREGSGVAIGLFQWGSLEPCGLVFFFFFFWGGGGGRGTTGKYDFSFVRFVSH